MKGNDMESTQLKRNDPSLHEKVQGYVTTEKTFHIDAFDMEEITEAVYGTRIEMLESNNDTTHEYHVAPTVSERDQIRLDNSIIGGYLDYNSYGIILNDLCKRGLLEPGHYFLRMSW